MPPWWMPENAVHWAAACISGAVAYHAPPPTAAWAASDSAVTSSRPLMADDERVGLAPQHGLGRPVVPPVHTR